MYFSEILSQDSGSLVSAVMSGDNIADEELTLQMFSTSLSMLNKPLREWN